MTWKIKKELKVSRAIAKEKKRSVILELNNIEKSREKQEERLGDRKDKIIVKSYYKRRVKKLEEKMWITLLRWLKI
jgi:hypothetical protein